MRGLLSVLAGAGAPLRAGMRRAVVEGLAGYAIMLATAAATDPAYRQSGQDSILALLGWVWLALWPAWRLRRLGGRFPARVVKGSARAVLCGLLLGVLAVASWAVLWPMMALVTHAARGVWVAVPIGVTVPFLGARALVIAGTALYGRARRRLRWQLTASHLAVIMLTFIAMTALGTSAGVAVAVKGFHSDAGLMATSVSALLSGANRADPLRGAQGALDAIQAGRILLRGAPPLTTLARNGLGLPQRVLVARPDGVVLDEAMDPKLRASLHLSHTALGLPAASWRTLRREALAGRAATITLSVDTWLNTKDTFPTETAIGAAPVRDARGRPIAVALVAFPDVNFKPNQVVAAALAVFGVTSLLVLFATSLPVLLLSILFGYLLARGLTRRLEAVSRVTTAIAAGDLSQRVPVRAADETGRLAESVNRMAASLGTAMGELRRARAGAEDALRARQELVASISHELRTPLAIVRAHLDNLSLRQPRPQPLGVGGREEHGATGGYEAHEREVVLPETTLRALQHETERLAVLVDDLFTLARAQTGALQVVCARVDVSALVDEVAALMRPLAYKEGHITLTVNAPPLPMAWADAGRLRQILENLVRNAVRHTPDGGIIALSVTAGGDAEGYVVVTVADTGEGMAPEHLPHIFERFYRVDQSRTRESGGAGLGLAIVREFVELMGGRVTVESALGEGSCFRVYLPLADSR